MTHPPSKAELRTLALQARAEAYAADPRAGETLATILPADALPPPGSVAAGYVPFRSEIDPQPLMARLARAGVRLALPVTPARGGDAPLTFRLWSAGDGLAPGNFGVYEPLADAPEVEPDLLLVPLLAFDRRGHRLGYGAGHYDRTIVALRAVKPLRALGLAFAAQAVEAIPTGAHDQPLDAIVTERAYIAVR